MSLSEPFTRGVQQESPLYVLATGPPATRHPNVTQTTAPHQGQSSRHRGVSLLRRTGRWHAQINFDGRQIHLGFYAQELEAAAAYDRALLIKWAAPLHVHPAADISKRDALVGALRASPPQTNLGLLSYVDELPTIAGITPARLLAALGNERLRKSVMDSLAHGFSVDLNRSEDGVGGGIVDIDAHAKDGMLLAVDAVGMATLNVNLQSEGKSPAAKSMHMLRKYSKMGDAVVAPATPKLVMGRNLKNNRRKPAMPLRGSLD